MINQMKNNTNHCRYTIIFLLFLLNGCTSSVDTNEVKDKVVVSNQVEFTPQQAQNLPIELSNLIESPFEKIIQATGQVKVSPENSLVITFPISGNISWLKSGLLSGVSVVKGEKLAEMYSLEAIRLQEEFQVLRVQQKRALAEKERQKKLSNVDATSQKMQQEVEETFEMNQVRIASLKVQLMAMGLKEKDLMSSRIVRQLPIISPIDGTLVEVFVQVGGKVTEMGSLFQLAKVNQGMVVCKLHQEDVQKIKVGQPVYFPAYPSWVGSVLQVGAIADEQNQTVDVFVKVNDMTAARLEQRLQVEIRVVSKQVTSLPITAIQTSDAGEKFVWVQFEEKERVLFKQIPVKIGDDNGKWVEVLSPTSLKNVVVNGAIYLVTEGEE